ncbi:Mo25 domain-containing protein [Cephalotus follicularis]|uniref:Mo25 domain-containing protein n=1 Tax=Cephalotus follicularis TaxID=3775 RepID=A0A1Q3C331_CEPFO|nr:Mo25 domain-containing protein [Cephalotus follicularis]
MKGLFKSKPRTQVELVQQTRELLRCLHCNNETRERKREEKMVELSKLILEMRTVLYGNGQMEPSADACAQLTLEFFKEDTFRLLIICLPKLDLGARQDATHVVANLQRQRVQSRLIASEYLEKNLDVMDTLIPGYEDGDIALTYGAISRECIRHQSVARYVLESDHMKKFFRYIQIPNFDIASDVQATFKELLTRHKSTVAGFLSNNYDWFFQEYNSQLLESSNYITRRHAIKLLGDMLLDRSNSAVMVRYVSSLNNMRILMNLLRDTKKTIQLETFHVFKLFVANQNKPVEIINVLITNRTKLLRFLGDFKIDKDNEQFEADKSLIIEEIATLELKERPCTDTNDSENAS